MNMSNVSIVPNRDDPARSLRMLVRFFETLSLETLPQIHEIYARNAYFKDPFNEVEGSAAIESIFRHMFASLENPRFEITEKLLDGDQGFLTWEFHFRFRRYDTTTDQTIRGGSHVTFDENGRVLVHRDYWDAAEELYEKIPGLSAFMRWLKRRASS